MTDTQANSKAAAAPLAETPTSVTPTSVTPTSVTPTSVTPTFVTPTSVTPEPVVLAPSFKLPLGMVAIALPLILWQPWGGVPVLLLAAFLALQTTRIRLAFTDTALEVRLDERLLRQFPYAEWQHWEIFWPPVPILFYFREVNSIHFLPILFSPDDLRAQLEQHVGLETSLETSLETWPENELEKPAG